MHCTNFPLGVKILPQACGHNFPTYDISVFGMIPGFNTPHIIYS